MTQCRRLIVLAVVAGFLVFLPSCKHNPTAVGPFYVMLTYNNGSCQQNGSSGVIDVPSNENVIFQGGAALTQFQIQFQSCPFASTACPVNSPNGNSYNAGTPSSGAVGNTYNYTSMTINNQQCNMPGPMGMRIKTP